MRTELGQCSDLGFHGAKAIHEALKARKVEPLPSVRTHPPHPRTRGAWTARGASVAPLFYPAAEQLGLYFEDRVKELRYSYALSIVEKGKKKLEARVGDTEVHAHPRMIYDIISKGSWVDDPELQEMWAGLLASSCTEDGKDQSNLVYANILGQMTAAQSRILDYVCWNAKIGYHSPSKAIEARPLTVPTTKIVEVVQITDINQIDV